MLKKTTKQFIEDAKKIHGDKFDYSLVEYKGVKTYIKIKCSNNHIFEQAPNDHLNGHGCKICSGWGELKSNPGEFIERAKKIHGELYDYSKTKYFNYDTLVIITCKIHGDFEVAPKQHIKRKNGCQKCGQLKSAEKRSWNKEKFIEEAKKIHGDLYGYNNVEYKNSNEKVSIICKKHGLFLQTPKSHIHQNQGCPSCSFSKGEKLIEQYLKENNINFIPQYKFEECRDKRKLPFDFYLPEQNTVIEFHGIQHYEEIPFFENKSGGLKELKKRDKIKFKFCKLNKIKYIKISYKNISKICQIIQKTLVVA